MDFAAQRKKMVEEQLKPRGISSPRVLAAFLKVPREKFVPENLRHLSYIDAPLAIGEGQTISQPYVVALMTKLLELKGEEKVLEVGTGSGYQAAVLAELVQKVYTVERIPSLAKKAEERLKNLGYENVEVVIGDGTKGLPQKAPFEGIIVTAAAPKVPEPLFEQLVEGGRLAIPLGGTFFQELVRIKKVQGKMVKESYGGCRFVPLVGEYGFKK